MSFNTEAERHREEEWMPGGMRELNFESLSLCVKI